MMAMQAEQYARTDSRRRYLTGVALVALTVVGSLLFQVLNPAGKSGTALLVDVGVIMGLALVKAFLVGSEYMELRNSAGWLKLTFAAWIVLTWVGVVTASYLGIHLHNNIHFL